MFVYLDKSFDGGGVGLRFMTFHLWSCGMRVWQLFMVVTLFAATPVTLFYSFISHHFNVKYNTVNHTGSRLA
jgi:hypothetical protein